MLVALNVISFIVFALNINVHSQTPSKPYNVLFIVSDDLRADLGGYYGENDVIYTPNIDAFQNGAFTFTHAYTQCPLCGPTRNSFLTGTRPDTTRIWSIGPYFRERMINNTGKTANTIPQYFKEHGNYYTVGAGKIFHPGTSSGGNDDGHECNMGDDQPYSWSAPYWDCDQNGNGEVMSSQEYKCMNGTGCTQSQSCLDCLSKWNCYTLNENTKTSGVCPADCDDSCFPDYDVAQEILKYFQQITSDNNLKSKPFFIGAGLKRPHIPYYAPIRYYQQYGYDNNYTNIQIAKHRKAPYNMPIKATNNASQLAGYPDVAKQLYYETYTDPASHKNFTIRYIKDDYHHNLRGAYYSSIGFMDEQFGKIIKGLFQYNLWNSTVVLFVGDHGYHLGEQGCWAKITNFEVALRVPLIIRVPGLNEGMKSDILVEQLDMFPTLIDVAGIGFTDNIRKQLEGKSLFNIIKGKNNNDDEYYAYSQYPRGGKSPDYNIMGISMRTNQWRYTEWLGWNAGSNISKPYPIWDEIHGVELYNHSNITIDENDMNAYDNYNLAYDDNMKSTVNQLHQLLYQTWDNQTWAINKQSVTHISVN